MYKTSGKDRSKNLLLKVYPRNTKPWEKIYRFEENAQKCNREFEILQSLSSKGFPVPKALCRESNNNSLSFPFMIMHKEQDIARVVINEKRSNVGIEYLGIEKLQT